MFWRPKNLLVVSIVRVIAASRCELCGGSSPVCELIELRTLRREVNAAVRDGDNWSIALRRSSPSHESRKTRGVYEIHTFPFCRPVIVLKLKLLNFTILLRFLFWGSSIRVVWHVLGRVLPQTNELYKMTIRLAERMAFENSNTPASSSSCFCFKDSSSLSSENTWFLHASSSHVAWLSSDRENWDWRSRR